MIWKPKNKELENILDRAIRDNGAVFDTSLARTLSKNKKIRYLREKDYFYIGLDRNKKKSVLFFPNGRKPKKTKRGYLFP